MLFLISQITNLGFATSPTNSAPAPTHPSPCHCSGNVDKAEQQAYYPNVMGDSCYAWDAGMDYCQPGGSYVNATTGDAPAWCYDPVRAPFRAQDAKCPLAKIDEPHHPLAAPPCWQWCYVPAHCPGATPGSYFADEIGPQLYYSYEHCGVVDDSYTGSEFDPLAN